MTDCPAGTVRTASVLSEHQRDTEREGLERLRGVLFERETFKSQKEHLQHAFWKANVSASETLNYVNPSAGNAKWKKEIKTGRQIERDAPLSKSE